MSDKPAAKTPEAKSLGQAVSLLLLVVLAAGILLAIPAWLIRGNAGLEGLLWSLGLCALPGLLAIVAVHKTTSQMRIWTLLAAMLLRMSIVLAGVVILSQVRRDLGLLQFHLWLVANYLILLLVETWLLLPLVQQPSVIPRSPQDTK